MLHNLFLHNTRFSPTRLAFGVLTVRIENRIVFPGVGGSPPPEPGYPDDPNLVPPMKKSQNNDPEMAPTNHPKMIPKSYAPGRMAQGIYPRAYAPGHMPQGWFQSLPPIPMLQNTSIRAARRCQIPRSKT